MQNQSNTASTLRSFIPRGTQIGFIAGLILGILLGWLFSGVVGAVMRLGFISIALILLLGALFFWWNTRQRPRGEGPTVYTWSNTRLPQNQGDMFRDGGVPRRDPRDQEVIDLEELKKQMDRERGS